MQAVGRKTALLTDLPRPLAGIRVAEFFLPVLCYQNLPLFPYLVYFEFNLEPET